MSDSPGLALFIAALLFFVGSYALGTQQNVRLGNNALKWLQQGLPLVGEKTTMRWLGSSVVELKIAKAKEPFRSAELLVVLEPRDVPIMWWWERARGRRDLLIVRAQLRAVPRFELEARSPKIWAATDSKQDLSTWTTVPGELAHNLRTSFNGDVSASAVSAFSARANLPGVTLMRLAVHRRTPNLEVHLLLPNLTLISAQRVLDNLRQLGAEALKL